MKGRSKGMGPKDFTAKSNVVKEAKARKSGGKACGDVMGDKPKMNMGRPARKSGGGVHGMPLMSAAAAGTPPKGHKVK